MVSMPQSSVSRVSASQGKMRNNGANVDETLFGTKKTPVEIRDEAERRRIAQDILKGDPKTLNKASILSQDELIRIKNACVIMSKEEQLQQKKILNEQKEKQQAAAKAKKQKMLEIEEEKRKIVPLSSGEQEEKEKNNSMKNRATEIYNEQLDEVKHMNQMMLYAKCVTIRDKQLEEKRSIIDEKKREEKRKDLMMEIERLRKIKYHEEIEKEKKEELKKGHLVIIDQIKERDLDRLKKLEEKEREGQEIVHGIRQLQKEEGENGIKRRLHQKSQQDQIYDANQNAITSKQSKIIAEKEEEEKIVRYNIDKAQKEAEYLGEQKRIKDEKEKEVQRLRDMQEKANDRQSELDALRAKRAVELGERQARDKEKKEAETKDRKNKELFEARQLQSLEKEERLQDQAKQDRDEFQRIIINQKQDRDIEIKLEQDRKEQIRQHAGELRKQVVLNEEKTKQDKRTYLEEGKKIKDNLKAQKKLLEEIKVTKLNELQENSIPKKYAHDLAKKKIVI